MREGWTYKKLGEVVDVINGLWTGKKEPFINIAVIRNANFTKACTIDLSDVAYIDVEERQFKTRELKYGDIIVEKSGGSDKQPVGRPVFFYLKENGYSFSNFTATLRVKDFNTLMPQYLHKVLLSQYNQGVTRKLQSKTTGLHNLNFKSYLNCIIPFPTKSQQEAIVSELDEINSLLALKREQLKKYDKLAQSLFYEMFGDPVENEKGWEVKKLGEICDVRDGTHDSPQYLQNSPYILITSKNIVNGKIDYSNINYISEEDYNAINKRSQVDEGDIIMPMIGTIGNPIIVKLESYRFCIKNVALIKFFSNSSVSNIYIHSLLYNDSYTQYIKSQNKGGTQKFIALGSIRKLLIPLPPLSLQQKFASRIEQIELQKQQVQAAIEKLETLLASRMQYWFE